jgi:serine/threonine protein kinase/tetratricopeptide (TPR) repeat protein
MDRERYRQAKEIFLRISELAQEERPRALAEATAGDAELRAEVESLLAHDRPVRSMGPERRDLSAPAGATVRTHRDEASPGGRIGPYRVLHELGSGGMGVVYLAVREEGRFRQHVALKVMKRGLDTDEILRRFEQERQLLAALNHPNIARLYDGGALPDGRPYFAMEHVDGLPIDEYCDRNRLSIVRRLDLFVAVCDAVQHAHRNLAVHRDLKPDNILVTADGVPKLLDFGIAKIINPELSLLAGDPTAPEVRLMTPEYASPEQIRGEHISTASDVYSLGVILFELMTGHRPYRLRSRVRAEIERVILEVEPERPSTAISRIEEVPEGADEDGTTPTTRTISPESVCRDREERLERLRRRLAGDIDNIVLMALRKEPQRRYASAERFAEDIRRHLDGLPVTARGNGLSYRAGKFVGRHKAGVSVVALVVVAACLAVVLGFVTLDRKAARARANAADVARQAAEGRAANEAERASRLVRQIGGLTDFYLGELHDGIATLRGSVEVRAAIAGRARDDLEALRAESGDDPGVLLKLAEAYQKLGEVQGGLRNPSLGMRENALVSLDTALELCERILERSGGDRGDRSARRRKAMVLVVRGDLLAESEIESERDRGFEEVQRADKLAEALLVEDPAGAETRRVRAITLDALGKEFKRRDRVESARACYERSVRLREELARERPDDVQTRRDLSVGYNRLGGIAKEGFDPDDAEATAVHLEAALAWYQKALDIRRGLLDESPENNREARDLAQAHLLVGSTNARLRRIPEATEHVQAYVDLTEQLAWDSPNDVRAQGDLLRAHQWIGLLFGVDGDRERAIDNYRAYEPLLARFARAEPDDAQWPRLVAETTETMAAVLMQTDDAAAAERALGRAVDATRAAVAIVEERQHEVPPSDRIDLARRLGARGRVLIDLDRPDDARPVLRESISIYEGLVDAGADSAEVAEALERVRGDLELLPR